MDTISTVTQHKHAIMTTDKTTLQRGIRDGLVKAIIYHSHTDIRLEQRPVPVISDDELLLRSDGCGLCGSDILKIVQRAAAPVILGHELTGTIVEQGRHVTQFVVGQRVVVAHHVPCGHCHYCQHQNYSMCLAFKASNIDPCGLAEYVRVPGAHVQQTTLPLPETLSAEEGSFTEPLACCVRAVRRTPILAGDSVVVMGLGSIGLLMLQALKALNDIQVYGVDIRPERLQLAQELGADAVFIVPSDEQALRKLLSAYTQGRGVDSCIITSGGTRPFQQAMASVRKGGSINIFAAHPDTAPIPINLAEIYQNEIGIISTYSSSPEDLRIALSLLSKRQVRVEQLISHRLPLEDFQTGVKLMREQTALKVYFQM